mmetsp:Transcript_36057/g.70883  ORF Transcript_36057/g.70883 Transcript_36057/m.70883 type:complete len:219 (+) Transcript_36057:1159-1815(+)
MHIGGIARASVSTGLMLAMVSMPLPTGRAKDRADTATSRSCISSVMSAPASFSSMAVLGSTTHRRRLERNSRITSFMRWSCPNLSDAALATMAVPSSSAPSWSLYGSTSSSTGELLFVCLSAALAVMLSSPNAATIWPEPMLSFFLLANMVARSCLPTSSYASRGQSPGGLCRHCRSASLSGSATPKGTLFSCCRLKPSVTIARTSRSAGELLSLAWG